MKNLKNLHPTVLNTMLAQHIKEYTKILFSDCQDGLDVFEMAIFQLQEEINARSPKLLAVPVLYNMKATGDQWKLSA